MSFQYVKNENIRHTNRWTDVQTSEEFDRKSYLIRVNIEKTDVIPYQMHGCFFNLKVCVLFRTYVNMSPLQVSA